ncbi:MAG: transcription termination/antitermination protein NusA [Rickettsiales bacterium]|nr:transcription termination/antitermination protein NusA [Rickettsiales bacterium]
MSKINNIEIIQVADAVAREKGIARHIVIQAIEQAIQSGSKKKYGTESKIKVKVNQTTGEISITRERTVVENVNEPSTEISLNHALRTDPNAKIGDILTESLPAIDIARIIAQSVKQAFVQKVREAEKEKQYEEFKDKQGEIINGAVKRFEFDNIIVDLEKGGEGLLRRNNTIKGETFKVNDRIRCYIQEINRDSKNYQIILSRVHPDFLAKLFAQEIPEVYDKIIEIKKVARDPGSKSKVAVYTQDSTIDPVGSCVGVRGSRIQSIINELQGEKIDIIKWSQDPAKFVINALAPAKASKVIIDEEDNRIEVILPQDQLSLAIGRKGQNVRLASQLTGWNIDILTEEEESKRRVDEFHNVSKLFMTELGLEEVLAQLLVAEGFQKIEDLANISLNELCSIEGINEELANALISRSQEFVANKNEKFIKEINSLGVDKNLLEFLEKLLSIRQIATFAAAGIKSFEDLAELSNDEFKTILPSVKFADEEINEIIKYAQEATNKDSSIDTK